MAAATHPERVESLVLHNGFARLARADDYPAGMPESAQETVLDNIERSGAPGPLAAVLAPSVADRARSDRSGGDVSSASPARRARRWPRRGRSTSSTSGTCSRSSRCPRSSSQSGQHVRPRRPRHAISPSTSRARGCWSVDSADHWPLPEPELLGAIEEFVTGARSAIRDTDRVLATVLFMDVVGSTERASELGDESWRRALDLFERTVRDGLALYAGTADEHRRRRVARDVRRPGPRDPVRSAHPRRARTQRARGAERAARGRGDEARRRRRRYRRAHRRACVRPRGAGRGARDPYGARPRGRIGHRRSRSAESTS